MSTQTKKVGTSVSQGFTPNVVEEKRIITWEAGNLCFFFFNLAQATAPVTAKKNTGF